MSTIKAIYIGTGFVGVVIRERMIVFRTEKVYQDKTEAVEEAIKHCQAIGYTYEVIEMAPYFEPIKKITKRIERPMAMTIKKGFTNQ